MGEYLAPEQIIDYDEIYQTVTAAVASGATTPTETEVFRLQLKPGKQPFLKFLGNAIQAGGAAQVTFVLEVNRGRFYPFDGSLNQWAPPESNFDLPVPYRLPVGSEVRVIAINADTANTWDATARVRIVYADF